MFDFAGSEILLIGIVALVAIGPKDLPVAIKAVSGMVKKARKMAGEFQTHVDEMVREADLGDARSAFNDLRRMDIKGQLLKAVDGDGTIRKTLSEPVMAAPTVSAGGQIAEFSPPPVPVHDSVHDSGHDSVPGGAHDIVQDIPVVADAAGDAGPAPLSEVSVAPHPVPSQAMSSDPAPAFVPPRYAPPPVETMARVPPAFIPPAFIPAAATAPASQIEHA